MAAGRTERWHLWNRHLVGLARDPRLRDGELGPMLAQITEAAARALDVGRASVWLFTDDRSAIVCEDLYAREEGAHARGLSLAAADYPAYFAALHEDRVIDADDALEDPRTREFADGYLRPLGIRAMLDVPIRRAGVMIGVLCHEHLGAPRAWTLEESLFAGSVGDFVTMALEAAQREQTARAAAQVEREAQRLRAELDAARRIQAAVLPRLPLRVQGYDVHASMTPASEVGGDSFDVLPAPGGAFVAIGDVSGHGLGAGLVMLMVQSALAALVRQRPTARPSELLAPLAAVVYEGVRMRLAFREHVTFTLLRCFEDGRVLHAGAHQDLLVYRADERLVEAVPTQGSWLGLSADLGGFLIDRELHLHPGDVLCLHTDGITEVRTEDGGYFGLERLSEAFCEACSAPGTSLEAVAARVLEASRRWGPADDDQTLVLLRCAATGRLTAPPSRCA